MSRLYSLTQAVTEIGADVVSVDQLTEWLKQGRISGRKIGRKWAMTGDDIADFITSTYRPVRAEHPTVVTEFALTTRPKRTA